MKNRLLTKQFQDNVTCLQESTFNKNKNKKFQVL